jgi:hypothetical protein
VASKGVPNIAVQSFTAQPDVPVYFNVNEIMILLPFFRKRDCGWIDATGEYDFCLDDSMQKLMFINRTGYTQDFCYRFVSTFFPRSAFKG